MVSNWLAIAKAEFQVMSYRFKRRRVEAYFTLVLIGIFWALYIVPMVVESFVDALATEIQVLLAIAFPGLMRSIILLLWVMVLVFPISYALQEIRIGQWEIMLSNNVSTREMLLGMFVGKIPMNGLYVLFLAPVLLTPFMLIYEVSILGQALAYLVLTIFALSTLLLSTILSTALQAKIGDSERGNDIAKAMGVVVAIVVLIPMYGLMYFSDSLAQLMGLDVFLLLPSTWGADVITWIIIYFNGINLAPSAIIVFEGILGLSIVVDIFLVGVFALVVIALGISVPDRLFSFESGARTEKVTTVGRENIVLRGIRRISSGPFGVLVVISMKDFGRKAQNVTRVIYGVFLAILFPVMLNVAGFSRLGNSPAIMFLMSIMISMLLGMICGITFGGIGFLESKDHLWIIKSSPNGVSKFVKARLVEAFLIGIPLVLIPVCIITVVLAMDLYFIFIMSVHSYLILCGAVLIGIGITSMNPAYENTKSSAFYVNTFASIFVIMIAVFLGLAGGLFVGLAYDNLILGVLISSAPTIVLGSIIVALGIERMKRPDM